MGVFVGIGGVWQLTHFEKNFKVSYNLGPNQRTLKKIFKGVKFGTNLTHFENFFQRALPQSSRFAFVKYLRRNQLYLFTF